MSLVFKGKLTQSELKSTFSSQGLDGHQKPTDKQSCLRPQHWLFSWKCPISSLVKSELARWLSSHRGARISLSLLWDVCFCYSCHRGPVLLMTKGQREVLLINWLVFITVVFLHQYCCVSLRHVTPSVFKYCPLSLGNTGINRELVEMQNLGGLPHTPSSVCFVVLQYPLLCLP